MTTIQLCALTALMLGAVPIGAQAARPEETPERQIVAIAQELFDAVAKGDKAVWDHHLADSCEYTDENGDTSTKAELLAQLRPLPNGYSGSIKIVDAKVDLHGDTAILRDRAVENETVFGQTLVTEYRSTDTYMRMDGEWKLVASQVMVVPSPRKSTAVGVETLDSIVGRYELAPGASYTIERRGSVAYGRRDARPEEELVAASDSTFFRKGTTRGEKIFVRDAKGHVTKMIDRRDNNDLVWTRVPSGKDGR